MNNPAYEMTAENAQNILIFSLILVAFAIVFFAIVLLILYWTNKQQPRRVFMCEPKTNELIIEKHWGIGNE